MMKNIVYLGKNYESDDIQKSLESSNLKFDSPENVCGLTAKLLNENKIIGWFQGRSEIGPRALGNRSILANPCNSKMKDIINSRVKFRESFRPFAPIFLQECVEDYFTIFDESKFMLKVFYVKDNMKDKIPAVVHVDGTSRLQIINESDNKRMYDLINEFRKLTDVPAVLNTSFNIKGEPIVETPMDAINCFLKTDIDVLVIDKYVVQKNEQ